MSQNPNYNPYNPNPSDPNQNPGTAYGSTPPPPPPGPPSGPGPGSNPNYNPYPGNPPTPGPGQPPNTVYDPYNPYQANPTLPASPGPGSNPNYYPTGPNEPTIMSQGSNPNFPPNQQAPYQQAPYQQAPYQQAPSVPPLGSMPSAPPRRPRRTGRVLAIIGGVLLLLIIAGIIIGVAANNNIQTSHANATATARTNGTAQANTAATAAANATAIANATASAVASATAAAALVNPYPPGGGTLALNDPLSDNSKGYSWATDGTNCLFANGVYQVNEPQSGFFRRCLTANTHFSDFAYQVEMTILQGDGGGIVFRADASNTNYYYFHIDTSQNFELYKGDSSGLHKIGGDTSSAINTNANQVNVLGVVAQGSSIDLFVNGTNLATYTDSSYDQGRVGLAAQDDSNNTEVAFANAKVWIL